MEITGKRGPEGVVKAVCTSEKKGVEKHSVPEGHFLKDFGIEGDAHAGKWHRQVSLLSYDKVKEFNERGAQVEDGAFGENLVVEGIDFRSLPVGMMIGSVRNKNAPDGKLDLRFGCACGNRVC